jgi:hypothetical protein
MTNLKTKYKDCAKGLSSYWADKEKPTDGLMILFDKILTHKI